MDVLPLLRLMTVTEMLAQKWPLRADRMMTATSTTAKAQIAMWGNRRAHVKHQMSHTLCLIPRQLLQRTGQNIAYCSTACLWGIVRDIAYGYEATAPPPPLRAPLA